MAAALPFYRYQKWLNFEALVIGTMLPDLPYFLNSNMAFGQQSHQWLGVFTYCLPWGLAVFILWFWLCRPAALALIQPWCRVQHTIPLSIQSYTAQHPFGLWLASKLKQYSLFWLKVMAGLMLGAITHLLWDGTTHPDGFIALQVEWLQHPVSVSYLGNMPVARLLQYVTSALGIALLIGFTRRWLHKSRLTKANIPTQKLIINKWQSITIIILLCLCALYWGLHAAIKWHKLMLSDNYLFLAKILVGSVQGASGLFILYALLYWGLSRFARTQRL
jgi:hypothetical protein